MNNVTPYSNYHPEALSMVGSPINQAVLLYIICRFQEKLRNGVNNLTFILSANKIAAEKNISWRSVKQSLDLFAKRKMIEVEDVYCHFNEDVYWKYLHKFQSLSYSERVNFSTLFADPKIDNDEFDQYQEMGSDNSEDFRWLTGCAPMKNVRTLCKMSEPSDISQNPMKNVRTLCKMSEPSDISQNPMKNVRTPELIELCKMLEGYEKCQNLMQNVRRACLDLSYDASQNYSKSELKALLKDNLDAGFDLPAIIHDILSNPTEFTPEKLLFLAAIGSDVLQKRQCDATIKITQNNISSYAECQNKNNVNKNNEALNKNINDKVYENEELEENCVNFNEPLPIVELKGVQAEDNLPESKELEHPFLSVEQAEEIVNNIEVAKQSSFKLFLFNLWGYASDMTNEGYDTYLDEEDGPEIYNEIEEEFFDPEGCLITRSDYRQLLLESYEQTQADIEKGEMEYGEETLNLTLTEMFPRNLLFKILDWKETAMNCRESSVIISKSGIRNIEAEALSTVAHPKTREEKRQAAKKGRELMAQLYEAKRDSGIYSKLTTIEKIAADIVDEYFQPNPDKESCNPFAFKSRNILTREEWRTLKYRMDKAGVKVPEFLSCLLNNDGPNDGDQLPLQNPMFYAEGIRHWNEVHQEISVLRWKPEPGDSPMNA